MPWASESIAFVVPVLLHVVGFKLDSFVVSLRLCMLIESIMSKFSINNGVAFVRNTTLSGCLFKRV